MKRPCPLFCAALLLAARAAAQLPRTVPEPLPDDPMKVTVHRLKNGLSVYLSPNPAEPRIAARIAVRAGGKHDPEDSTGMAHYLEHMLFKGSSRLGTTDYAKEKAHLDDISDLYERLFWTRNPKERDAIYSRIDSENVRVSTYAIPNELARLYKSLGFSGLNAYTSEERTVYVCDFPKNRAEAWAKAEADRFSRPVFRLFQSEIETVYEEKNRSMDNAGRILQEALDARLFKDHPYGRTVLGTIEHLKNPSLAKMYAFFDTYYRPNNMAVALSGDFKREEMLRLVSEHLGKLEPKPLPAPKQRPVPSPSATERVEIFYEHEEQVTLGWLTAPNSHPDAEALAVLDMLVDNAAAGLLNLHLNQEQRVKSSGSFPQLLNDAGAWFLWAVPKKGQTLEEAQALLLAEVDKLKAGEFGEEELEAVKTDFEVQEKLGLESNGSRADLMAGSFAELEEWERTAGRLRRIRAVTKEDVVRTARKYLGENRVAAYRRLGKPEIPSIRKPDFTKISLDPSRESPFYRELLRTPAEPLEPRWLKAGRDYAVRDLPWGRLYASKNPFNDLFSLTFAFDIGQDRVRELCAALDLLELSGAGDLPADAFKKRLYALGTTMSVSCGERGSSVRLSGLDANFEKSLELLFRRFSAPNVAPDTLKKLVEVKLGAHQDNKKKPDYVYAALREYATRGERSSVLTELTDAEWRALAEDRLQELVRSLFAYRRKAIYAGVREPEAVAPLLSGGRTEFGPPPPWEPLTYLKPEKPKVLFAQKEMVQSLIGLYAPDGPVDPDETVDSQYYGAYMGGMSGVIFQEVREARSLAYSASGGHGLGGRKGDENLLWGRAGCQADKARETAALLRELLLKLPPSRERFETARRAVEQDYRTQVATFRQVPGLALRWEELGIAGGDPRPRWFERALRYRLEDLLRFAARFEAKTPVLVVLGDKGRTDLKGLEALGGLELKTIDELFPY